MSIASPVRVTRNPDTARRLRDAPWSHLSLIALLGVAQVALMWVWSVASSDTNRDVFWAQQIASGQDFPLTGPAINSMMYLGPLWFYLLAPAMLLPNAAAGTAMMGAISALQFPLAYLLGLRLRGAREGLLLCVALSLPGWYLTAFASATHTLLIIPSLLAGVLATMHYRQRPGGARALLLGVVLLLMETAHPTLVSFAAVFVLCALARSGSWTRRIAHLAWMVLPPLCGVLPMLWHQWQLGFPMFDTMQGYTRSEWSRPSLVDSLAIVHALVWYGPQWVTRIWLEAPPAWNNAGKIWTALLLALAVAGLALGWVRERAVRRLVQVLVAALVLQSMFLDAIRETMPPWMIFSLWAIVAALIALGLGQLWGQRLLRGLVIVLLAGCLAWTARVYLYLAEGSARIQNIAPAPGRHHGFMNVRHYDDSHRFHFTVPRIEFRWLYALAAPECAPVALYGHYAYLVDYTHAIGDAHHCGGTGHVRFGGPAEPGRRVLFGLQRDAWAATGHQPQRWIGSLGIAEPAAIWNEGTALEPVKPVFVNFPRKLDVVPGSFDIERDADAREFVVVAHRAYRYEAFDEIAARVDGVAVQPVYRDEATVVFTAPAQASGMVRWQLQVQGTRGFVDVLSVAGTD